LKQCEFGPRTPGSNAHVKCRDYLLEEFKKSSDNARLQEFTHLWSSTGRYVTMWNVIGEQNWKDAKQRVVLLAHWDTRPTADQETDPVKVNQPILGANDGASGVAVLLELMRTMKGRLPADLGVMYVLTDGEDLGPSLQEMFLGASAFAKKLPAPKPDYGILIDMIGDKDLSIPMELQSLRYADNLTRTFYRKAAEAGQRSTFPMVYGEMIEDDHIPLNKAGIPTIDLIDFNYGPNHSAWHTHGDRPNMCSADSLGKVGIALEAWLTQAPVYVFKK
jgi:glutaminyl-peptide cyclotransferase